MAEMMPSTEWFSALGPILLVLVLLGVTLYALKRVSASTKSYAGQNFKVTPLHSFGPKQQLAIIEIRGEQILLGVTQTSITRLAQWAEPVQITDDPLVDQ